MAGYLDYLGLIMLGDFWVMQGKQNSPPLIYRLMHGILYTSLVRYSYFPPDISRRCPWSFLEGKILTFGLHVQWDQGQILVVLWVHSRAEHFQYRAVHESVPIVTGLRGPCLVQ
jgi:hypothetical protein